MIAAMMDVHLSMEIVLEINAIQSMVIVLEINAIQSTKIVLEIIARQFMEFVLERVVTLYMRSVLEIIALQFMKRATVSTAKLFTMFVMEISVKVGLPVMARDVQQLKEIVME